MTDTIKHFDSQLEKYLKLNHPHASKMLKVAISRAFVAGAQCEMQNQKKFEETLAKIKGIS